ncbi:right-handed parallel beta-helix repeat-containing protein [Cohnella zeiphila]|uniref:Right-handed parallel beta-helix repeat-containing protein n=1 Tax=Cohnella zeiphila TaxID=2761120 RepID=A0A7X0SSB3_9BACL|nr:right-handed parallel beta-helix repeat-containing protein [Cohnella zeiphila]MBB6732963.1 right-handed parallel beta-helix repeat-containing protein [Cohnella zeiphila]
MIEIRLYVRADAEEDGDGSQERPFRTIAAAQEAVRGVLRAGHEGSITVSVGGGVYELAEPLRFGSEDAGGEQCRVAYEGEPGDRPVLLGGTVLSGWEPWRAGIWRTKVPAGRRFQTLYADGERVVKARWPASGYMRSATVPGREREGIGFREEDLADTLAAELETGGLQVYVWPGEGEWNWLCETIPVRRIDAAARFIEFARPSVWSIGEGSRYYLQGSLRFLLGPGQFHLDEADGWLYYRPAEGVPDRQRVVAPIVLRILDIQGESMGRPVSGLSFRNLELACTDCRDDYQPMSSEPDMANSEPDEHRNGLVYIRNASDLEIESCELRLSGSNGVFLDRCAERVTLTGNRIERVGHNGIYASGYAPGEGDFAGPDEAFRNKGHTIADNVIERGGELVGHGSGIMLYQCGECEIAHNRISRMPRYGISLKGLRRGTMPSELWGVPVTWDNHWDFLFSRNNLIRHNDISAVMEDSQDGGMIEAWGPGLGNRIEGNRLHHSGIHFSFGFGIYLDDAADGFEVTGNVLDHLYSTGEGKLWMTIFAKGIGNRIAGNLIADNPDAVNAIGSQEMAGEANRDLVVERNIVCDSGHLYGFVNWSPERFLSADFNLFWRNGEACGVSGELPLTPAGVNPAWGHDYEWEAWQSLSGERYDANSVFAPPGFADAEAGDYRLLPSSPAYALGWEEIDFTQFGPRQRREAAARRERE